MRSAIVTGILLIFHILCTAQSLKDLHQEKEWALEQIETVSRLLHQTQKEEQSSLSRLRLISQTIVQRNILISNLKKEIILYQQFMEDNQLVIDMFTDDLEQIKAEYAQFIRLAYRSRHYKDKLIFLLSAEHFNQAYRRFLYLKRYTSYRKEQAEAIQAIQLMLDQQIARLSRFQEKREQLITEARGEMEKLGQEKVQQNQEISQLQQQLAVLRKKLVQHRKVEDALEMEIQKMFEEEARKNQEAGEPEYALTPEQQLLGANFEQNRQRLPWPVVRGIITEKFGLHAHPVLTNVTVRNNGISIATEMGAEVRAVFNGEVSRVFGITGGNSAVIIRHGTYLSVYSNLQEVSVKKGDRVRVKQVIGKVYTEYGETVRSILKFQIWHENHKLDPEAWLVK